MKKIIFILIFLILVFLLCSSKEVQYPRINVTIEKQNGKIIVYQDDDVVWEIEPQQEDCDTYYKVLDDIYGEAFYNEFKNKSKNVTILLNI